MHELDITQGIVNTALQAGENAGARKIRSVRVKIGAFTGVEPHCLEFYFNVLTKDTIAAGAELVVEITPLAATCSACREPFAPQELCFKCPSCGSPEVEITSGRELCVESVDVW